MRYYRLYFMHPDTGHIERFAEFDAPDDEAAFGLAADHIGDHPLELWCESRKVGRIEANDLGSQLLANRRAQREAPATADLEQAKTA